MAKKKKTKTAKSTQKKPKKETTEIDPARQDNETHLEPQKYQDFLCKMKVRIGRLVENPHFRDSVKDFFRLYAEYEAGKIPNPLNVIVPMPPKKYIDYLESNKARTHERKPVDDQERKACSAFLLAVIYDEFSSYDIRKIERYREKPIGDVWDFYCRKAGWGWPGQAARVQADIEDNVRYWEKQPIRIMIKADDLKDRLRHKSRSKIYDWKKRKGLYMEVIDGVEHFDLIQATELNKGIKKKKNTKWGDNEEGIWVCNKKDCYYSTFTPPKDSKLCPDCREGQLEYA